MAAVGLRVVRGPGWNKGEADGGEGHVGTVVATKDDGSAEVTWDGGQQMTVNSGSTALRVLDNAPVGIRHNHVTCDDCHETNIVGMRWKCAECYDFDLCSLCYFNDGHDRTHQFLRYETPDSAPVKMEKRTKCMKIRVMGIFPEATVVRGRDWEWGNQDGGQGKEGTVTGLLTPGDNSARSTVRVNWNSGDSNVYRLGFKGKVDLRYTEESPGGECYPQHLPIFDAKNYKQTIMADSQTATQDSVIHDGDRVYIDLPEDKVQQLRQARSDIVQVLNRVGVVQGTLPTDEALVAFGPRKYKISQSILRKTASSHSGSSIYAPPKPFNHDLEDSFSLRKTLCADEVPKFKVGDHVQVLADGKKVSAFQDGHGGYNRNMRSALGKAGQVIKIDSDGDIEVQFKERKWCYNPACLIPAPGRGVDSVAGDGGGGDSSDDSDEGESGLNMLGELMGAIALAAAVQARQGMGNMVFLKAVIDNDVSAVRQLLQKEPRLVGASEQGVGAIHIAANLGHTQITQILVENGAEINQRDKDGDTALIAGMKYDAIAEYLIKKGSDVNVANNNGQTASHRAAAYGHAHILRQLLARGADFNATDKDGDTPLHDAIAQSRTMAAVVLADCSRTDLRRKNKKGFTPLQFSAFKGEAGITEVLVRKNQSLVNEQKEDGFAALHVAAINNHTDVMKVLLERGKGNVDLRTQKKQTALHMAAQEAYMDAVQLLTTHGADVNAKDCDGDRPLHILLASHTGGLQEGDLLLMLLVGQAPKVKEEERVRIACYLLQAGADPEARNDLGKTAVEVCQNAAIVEAVKRFLAANPSLARQQRPSSAVLARQRSVAASDLCRRCCSRRANILLVPCGHKAVCLQCCPNLRACPQCGAFIRSMHDESGKDIKSKCCVM